MFVGSSILVHDGVSSVRLGVLEALCVPLQGPTLVFVLVCTLASGNGPDGSENISYSLVSEV